MAAFLLPAALLGVPAATAFLAQKLSKSAAPGVASSLSHVSELENAGVSAPARSVPVQNFEPMFSYQPAEAHAVVLSQNHPQAARHLRRAGMAVHQVRPRLQKPAKPAPHVVVGKIPSQQVFNKVAALPFVRSIHYSAPAPARPVSMQQVERTINSRIRALE